MCLSEIHRWLVHRYLCEHSCHDGEDGLDLLQGPHMWWKELIAYETWYGVMWSRWRRSRQDLIRQTGCKCEGQVNWWLGADGPKQRWRASEVVYTKIWKKNRRGLKAPKIMSSRNQSRADRYQLIRMQQQITTKATIGAGTRHVGLYKKGKIRVQVILN